jgi:hypothetical protein
MKDCYIRDAVRMSLLKYPQDGLSYRSYPDVCVMDVEHLPMTVRRCHFRRSLSLLYPIPNIYRRLPHYEVHT